MDVTPSQGQYIPTASPTGARQQPVFPIDADAQLSASSSSSSSYIMTGESTVIIPTPSIPDRPRLAASASSPAQSSTTMSGPMRPSRVSKPKSKPVGGSSRPPRNNSDNSQYQSQSDDQPRSFSSASSSASPPVDDSPRHRQRTSITRLSASGGIACGLLTTGHGGNHNVTLRTASRKPKTTRNTTTAIPKTESPNSDASPGSSPSSQDGSGQAENLTSEERRARQNHNIVEKQYRNRLNSQFERLLSILPANQMDGGSDMVGGRAVEPDDRRMSKAEVLDLARRRIHALENEIQQLYTDRDNLRSNVATLNMAIQHGQQVQQQQQNKPRMSITI
ncbi:hypothetical protein SEUCBS140593_006174 [Sporothrix eucalyptigena]|uniref:BHLH domain-containing protein n=1 Tax=Sporothrix eucalyptigena TaxID=1812306 RepID=A0ABP0C2P8_9PEZI